MITDEYIEAYKNYIDEKIHFLRSYNGNEYSNRITPYYKNMYTLISGNANEYIRFEDSEVEYFEMKFVENVETLQNKLISLAQKQNIPIEILFIPRVKIKEDYWDSIINVKVVEIVRKLFDEESGNDYKTLRKYKAFERNSPIHKWTKKRNGKNFLYEFQVSQGIRQEVLIKKLLYLFEKEFVRQQKMWMSEMIWMHIEVVNAFESWKKDQSLWKTINHVKRKIQTKELLDESRPEIKFLRILEKHGLKNKFIHDEQISWKLKYRPDFWFTKENLIVEYDEKAHKFQKEEDKEREKNIKKHIPNVQFIRIKEGFEEDGLKKIFSFLKKYNDR